MNLEAADLVMYLLALGNLMSQFSILRVLSQSKLFGQFLVVNA